MKGIASNMNDPSLQRPLPFPSPHPTSTHPSLLPLLTPHSLPFPPLPSGCLGEGRRVRSQRAHRLAGSAERRRITCLRDLEQTVRAHVKWCGSARPPHCWWHRCIVLGLMSGGIQRRPGRWGCEGFGVQRALATPVAPAPAAVCERAAARAEGCTVQGQRCSCYWCCVRIRAKACGEACRVNMQEKGRTRELALPDEVEI